MIAVKLIAVPVAIWLASYAGRRWGHRISGLISGFPLIAAPIVLFLSYSAPRAFVADTAWFTLAAAPAIGVHCLVYAWMTRLPLPRRFHWLVCLIAAWIACVSVQWLLSAWLVKGALGAALALGQMLLAAALRSVAQPPLRAACSATSVAMFINASASALLLVLASALTRYKPNCVTSPDIGYPSM